MSYNATAHGWLPDRVLLWGEIERIGDIVGHIADRELRVRGDALGGEGTVQLIRA